MNKKLLIAILIAMPAAVHAHTDNVDRTASESIAREYFEDVQINYHQALVEVIRAEQFYEKRRQITLSQDPHGRSIDYDAVNWQLEAWQRRKDAYKHAAKSKKKYDALNEQWNWRLNEAAAKNSKKQ